MSKQPNPKSRGLRVGETKKKKMTECMRSHGDIINTCSLLDQQPPPVGLKHGLVDSGEVQLRHTHTHTHSGESSNRRSNLSNHTASFSRLSSNSLHTHTSAHTEAESSQMFSISSVGLNESNQGRISCNHSRTIYTAGLCSSNCCLNVAQYLNSLTTECNKKKEKEKKKEEEEEAAAAACSKKLGRALRGSRCFSSARPLLHAKSLDSEPALDHSAPTCLL